MKNEENKNNSKKYARETDYSKSDPITVDNLFLYFWVFSSLDENPNRKSNSTDMH